MRSGERGGGAPARAVPWRSHASEVTPRFDHRRSTLLTDPCTNLAFDLNNGIEINGTESSCDICTLRCVLQYFSLDSLNVTYGTVTYENYTYLFFTLMSLCRVVVELRLFGV